jgi:hypothetical protein
LEVTPVQNNATVRRTAVSLIGPAALVGGAAVAGLWLALARDSVQVLLAAAALAATAVLGAAWLLRARAARRFNVALEAYATRELARVRRRKAPRAAVRQAPLAPAYGGEGLSEQAKGTFSRRKLHARPQPQAW